MTTPPPLLIPLPARAREALQQAMRERAEAERTEGDLLSGILLAVSDVPLKAIARYELTPDGLALTLHAPPPEVP